MLLQNFLNLYTPAIIALPFVERWGGVVQTYKKPVNNPETGEILGFDTFPVSCTVNEADCVKNQRYQDLIPNSNKKSVAYFEVIQGFQFSDGNFYLNTHALKMSGSARFVMWINSQKLGINTCNPAALLMPDVLKVLHFGKPDLTGTIFEKASNVKVKVTGEVTKTDAIFAQYSYNNFKGFLLHPYDYFALDIDIELTISKGCLPSFTPTTPIQCVDNTKL